jgi:hypothetical protein
MQKTHPGFSYASEQEGRAELQRHSIYQMLIVLVGCTCYLARTMV